MSFFKSDFELKFSFLNQKKGGQKHFPKTLQDMLLNFKCSFEFDFTGRFSFYGPLKVIKVLK
jgi:hypothetical protein